MAAHDDNQGHDTGSTKILLSRWRILL